MAQQKKTTKKASAKKPAPQKAASGRTSAVTYARHQAAAVALFAGAILVLCITLIRGGNVWEWLHIGLLGLFGVCAFLLPLAMGYVAVIAALERPIGSVSRRLWQCGVLLVMVASALEVFTVNPGGSYFEAMGAAFQNGAGLLETGFVNGGIFGVLLGYPLEYFFTDVGAKIIICLLIFVFLMLVTGTTILALFRALWKPMKKTGEMTRDSIDKAKQEREQRRVREAEEEEKRRAAIDIDIGEGYPAGKKPVDPDNPFVTEPEPMRPAGKSSSLQKLEKLAQDMHQEEQRPPLKVEDLHKAKKPADKPAKPENDSDYRFPPLSLLDETTPVDDALAMQELQLNSELLVRTLQEFGVSTKVVGVSRGPAVTRYELQPSAGVKISRITGLADDIALRLATTGVRIEAPIPNKAAVGIEVPNRVSASVCLRELIDSDEFRKAKSRLTVALGKDISGQIVLADLAKMPHLLIAGTTGSGKSVCTNSMIQSVLYRSTPEQVRMILIDPKKVEFSVYNGIPHLLVPVVTDPRKAAGALGWAVTEMLNRYRIFAENNVRDLASYNQLAAKHDTLQPMPLILIVIDELSDLMMAAANEVEDAICRLAQMARAAGMHLVIATQRPSVDVITGLIKANIPSRLALTVASAVDSRTILDSAGADKLLGRGDMLFMPVGMGKPMRIQGCFVSNREVESVVDFLKPAKAEEVQYDEAAAAEMERLAAQSGRGSGRAADKGDDADDSDYGDEMLPQAVEVALEAGEVSTSMLQRRLRLGYARAGRLVDEMEQRGIIGPHAGSKPRQVLITKQQWMERQMSQPSQMQTTLTEDGGAEE